MAASGPNHNTGRTGDERRDAPTGHPRNLLGRLKALKRLFARTVSLDEQLAALKRHMPVPVFWLIGKTQSGKTSIIRYLTGADDAEIGAGFKPTTRFSRRYQFPDPQVPLLTFLDTRGLGEPTYDPQEDIACFNEQTHLVIATARIMDHAQQPLHEALRQIRDAKPGRPIVLALTCLHEAYPQQQHPQPYRFGIDDDLPGVSDDLRRSLAEQRRRFDGLVDTVVPIDLTRPEEGFDEPHYGGAQLKAELIDRLPAAYRQTLLSVQAISRGLRDWHERRAQPLILGYSTLAAAAGAIPVPWLDLFFLPAIQTRMVYRLAQVYGQPLTAGRFLELAGALGLGFVLRQAVREVAKFVPGVGSLVGSALAGSSTYALGRAFCYYCAAVLAGHIPPADELRRYYNQELSHTERLWRGVK